SKMGTMLGWSSAAAARASVRKRSTASGDVSRPPRIILRATVRLSAGCRALYTTPMPPRAISWSNSYSPNSHFVAGPQTVVGAAEGPPSGKVREDASVSARGGGCVFDGGDGSLVGNISGGWDMTGTFRGRGRGLCGQRNGGSRLFLRIGSGSWQRRAMQR